MPNHLHGIIGIVEDEDVSGKGTMHRAPTIEQFAKPTSNSIPTIIRGFKSAVTKIINIKRNALEASVWQRNYYEQVIRNEPELNRIRKYIIENPIKWQYDKYY
jgi:REP element-mobilizing transposase RayT